VDVDGIRDDRSDTVSVFNRPPPLIRVLPDETAEIEAVGTWLSERVGEGTAEHAIGVFVRSQAELGRATAAVERAGLPYKVLDEHVEHGAGGSNV